MRFQGCTVWEQLLQHLREDASAMLLYVLDSQGSSPGRRGFALAVLDNGRIAGTIGGGIMEHKLVELARKMLDEGSSQVVLKEQHHTKDHPTDRSGMICSGSQLIAILPVNQTHQATIASILSACKGERKGTLQLDHTGISFEGTSMKTEFLRPTSETWRYAEPVGNLPRVHIIGAGHVGLALSELLASLGFHIRIYDDRSQLNTLEQNTFAHEKIIVNYQQIGTEIPDAPADYVVIMTFGYRSDKEVLLQLMDKQFKYLGMMGSDRKIAQLRQELEDKGIAPERHAHLKAPVGVEILSKTAREIAVSVAAELIREKNKHLPGGRTITNL